MRRLRKDLIIQRLDDGDRCYVHDSRTDKVFEFGALECYLIDLLTQQIGDDEIVSRWNARFGTQNTTEDLNEFLGIIEDWGLLETTDATGSGTQSKAKDDVHGAYPEQPYASATEVPSADETSRTDAQADAATNDAWGGEEPEAHDPRRIKQPNRWHLFCPERFLTWLCGWICPLRALVWATPLIFGLGVLGVLFNLHLVRQDLSQAAANFGLLGRLALAAFTVNLFSQLFRGLVARYYNLSVPSFGIALVFGLIPRFNFQVVSAPTMTREARLWLAATTTLNRMVLFGLSVFLWLSTRPSGSSLSSLGAELAFLCLLGLVFVVNPFGRGDGYNFLAIWLGTPNLRGRSSHALRTLFSTKPKVIKRYARHSIWLGLYALLSYSFLLFLIGFVAIMVSQRLEQQYHGAGVALFLLLAGYVLWSLRRQAQKGNRSKPAKGQGLRHITTPHKSTVAPERAQPRDERLRTEDVKVNRTPRAKNLLRILLAILIVGAAFIPYRYDPGGDATILPVAQHEINAETEGVVEEVFYNGGEWLEKGTIIAKLADHRQRKDVRTTEAAIAAKRQNIEVLLTTPSIETIRLAEKQLDTARLQSKYSTHEAQRMQQLYEKGTVSLQMHEDARKAMELDRQTIAERQASLESLKAQVNPNQIEAAELEVVSLLEQLAFYQEQLRRTELRMPISGHITTMNLSNLRNTYMEEGILFAEVEDSSRVRIEIGIPEAEIHHAKVGEPVSLTVRAYPDRVFASTVSEIGLLATDAGFGRTITIACIIDNTDGILKNGMTGFAKVEGYPMPAFLAFTQALVRFVRIEIWSWIP